MPGPRNAIRTVDKLMHSLTNDEVIAVVSRIREQQRFGLVHIERCNPSVVLSLAVAARRGRAR